MANAPRKAVWEKGPISKMPAEFQPKLFYEKMGDGHSIKENMCFEKAVLVPYFKALGFFEKFTTLGWEAGVSFKGNTSGEFYIKSVMEWMSTLTKNDGSNPPRTTTLTGTVNNKPVTLSPSTLRQLAKFDSKADNFYWIVDPNDYYFHTEKLVEDNTMLSELFMLEKGLVMNRDKLMPIVSLLLNFIITNVTPRLGDRMAVRKWELPVLYALMTGQLHLSFRKMVIMHVW
ncbi:hypothetical protein HanRHA438_Chr13g0597851 [Helianthus annuus]|uniref:Uncharacterized protein n=1 Tax=Helianthus annuus TaxID=4232 RepID=A0A9K3EHK2_HELAN|nr:hypothetical protein HanXRQr2_Chr13g0587241 [Helianthus annuus]KAJ0476822.1 hypothetical protein HanHA300_Chr13g0481571 [Helianthus annuus]KAJ0481161.1 hypothetical protein HanIR_Chr13g0639541 [Helianthus annuus]KAJ0497644.1 hypothetical protein HanHA89_Chr13g0513571 [Helianthus annuus]KAJ0663649.1 hypothetical protein HanLR1_Chr13g0483451 [Helianthus annuus]